MELVSTLTQEASIVALTPHLEAWNATEGLQRQRKQFLGCKKRPHQTEVST